MKVQILQCRHKGFAPIAWLIRLYEWTDYSHYAIGYTSEAGNYLVLDATGRNVAIRSSDIFLKHYDIVNEYTVTMNYKLVDFERWFEPHLGQSYGYMQLFGIMLRDRRLGRGWICNELVLRFIDRFFGLKNRKDIDIMGLNDTDHIVKRIADEL